MLIFISYSFYGFKLFHKIIENRIIESKVAGFFVFQNVFFKVRLGQVRAKECHAGAGNMRTATNKI